MDDIDELAGALYQHDLARVRACPLSLLLRRDACVPRLVADGTEEMCAAPLLCAIEYALDALWAHDDDRRLWTADWRPTAAVARLADAAPAYQVLDWFLGVFDDLDAPLDIVVRVGRQRATLTPLMYTLVEVSNRYHKHVQTRLPIYHIRCRIGLSNGRTTWFSGKHHLTLFYTCGAAWVRTLKRSI